MHFSVNNHNLYVNTKIIWRSCDPDSLLQSNDTVPPCSPDSCTVMCSRVLSKGKPVISDVLWSVSWCYSYCCNLSHCSQQTALATLKSPHSPLELTADRAKRGGMKSSQKSSGATVPQRRMFRGREEKKLAENQRCVTGKHSRVGGGRTGGEAGRHRGERKLTRGDALKGNKKKRRRGNKRKWDKRGLFWWEKKVKKTRPCGYEGESVDREVKDIFSGSRPSWCLRWTTVRSIPTLETAGGVNTAPASVIPSPTKLRHVFVHAAASMSQQAHYMLT